MPRDPFEVNVENPFSRLGLSPAAVEALASPGDPDILLTAVQGIQRSLARAIHPDALQGKETDKTSDFLDGVIKSATALSSVEKPNLMILAKDYARNQKRSRRNDQATPEVVGDYSLPIIHDLAQTAIGSLGVSLDPQTRVFIRRTGKSNDSNAHWAALQHVGETTYALTPYSLQPILDSNENERLAFKRFTAAIAPLISEESLQVPTKSSKRVAHDSLQMLEVDSAGRISLYGDGGKPVHANLPSLEESGLLEKPGFYPFVAKYSGGTRENNTLVSNYYAPNDTEEKDMRIIGTTDKEFTKAFLQTIERYHKGVSREAQIRANLSGLLPGAYPTKEGQMIPENFHKKLGKYFLPSVAVGRLLLGSVEENIYVLGHIESIFS